MIKKRSGLMLSMQMGKESIQNRKPMILVLAGSNGSGKSTIQTPCHDAGQYSADCVRYLLLSSFSKVKSVICFWQGKMEIIKV